MKNLFDESKKYIPGGVNSPVRSFREVGGTPVFVHHGKGPKIFDEDGKEYIDYCLAWGSLILGHAYPEVIEHLSDVLRKGTSFGTATKHELEFAILITQAIPSIQKVRLTSSGTEATMSAIRVARAYTGKNNIIKFEGAYHGHADYLLVKAGSGVAGLGIPGTPGVPHDFAKHTVVASFNDLDSVQAAVNTISDIAAIIVEPVCANCGVILPQRDFLAGLREICDKSGIVLIFDEVITGFRLTYGGIQNIIGINPDLTCLGKIIGGGMPLGAFGGKKEIMDLLAPEGNVYQAGTLSGNPVSVSAGIATLKLLRELNFYTDIDSKTEKLCDHIARLAGKCGIDLKINRIGSMFSLFFTDADVVDYKGVKTQNKDFFRKFYHSMLNSGIYMSPSGFESNFLSCVHREEEIEKTILAVDTAFSTIVQEMH